MQLRSLSLIPAFLALPVAHAQTPSPETRTLTPVVVSASRANTELQDSPQTVVIIDREQIEEQLTLTTNSSDILSNLLPSYTPSRGKMTGSGETLRGRTPLILIDGVPQSNPLRPTGREAHTIDFSMVERIEVVQGASAINGLGATGGTINIITRQPEDGAFNQHVDVQVTIPTEKVNAESTGFKTTYRADGRQGDLDYLFSVGYEDQGLHYDARRRTIGADNTQGDLMDSRAYDVLGKLGYRIDENQRVQLSVNRYRIAGKASYLSVNGNREQGIPTTSIKGDVPGTAPRNDVWTSSLSYEHHDLAGMSLSAMVFHQKFEGLFGADNSASFQDPAIAPVGTLFDQSRSLAEKYGSKVSLTKDDLFNDRLKVTVGVDTLRDKGEQDLYGTRRTWVPPSTYDNVSLFGQAEYRLLDSLVLHGGVRHERADLKIDSYRTIASANGVDVEGGRLRFNETLFNAGAVYTPWDGVSFFSSYSEGFGMPDVGRVLRGIDEPGWRVDALTDLAPILTRSVEAGTRIERGPFDAELSYFQSHSDFGSRIVPVNGVFTMAREKTRIQGAEASLGWRVNRDHRLTLGYAHTRGRYDSDGDGRVDARLDGLNIAPNRMIATWSARWTPKLSSFVQVQHAFSRDFDDPRKRFDGYTLVDAAMNYRLPKGTLKVGVANVFNEDYITYYSQSALVEPRRYFAGRGRTLTVGYSLSF
ncbi:TonB-dependent receptor [Achromobacter sp. GG226]|nr:TonB-dependent receptor [Verticiella sp. GG226]